MGEYLRATLRGGAGDDGLLQRFQLAVWPDCAEHWKNVDRWPDAAAKDIATATCDRLRAVNAVELAADRGDDGIPFLRFDSDAQADFVAWFEKLEGRVRSGSEFPAIESHLAKYRSLIPSLALLLHLADEPDGGPVSQLALNRALRWASYLETHARRMYGAVSQRSQTAAKALAGRIKKGELTDRFTLRDVYRNGWTHLSTPEDATDAARELVDCDWIVQVTEPTTGRSRILFVINPKIFEMCPVRD